MKKIFFISIGITFILYICAISWLLFKQNSYTFAVKTPDTTLVIPHRFVDFNNQNENLQGCVIPAVGERKKWVIFCHGAENTMKSVVYQKRYETWHKLNINIFTFDYTGYGNNKGNVSELGLYESARSAYHYLQNVEMVENKDIILYGEGIGVPVALDLARQVNVAGIILENGIVSLKQQYQETYPLLPVKWIIKSKFDADNKLTKVLVPKLFIYSTENSSISPTQTQRLYQLALPPKDITQMKGDYHQACTDDNLNYQRSLSTFLQEIYWR